MEGENVGKLAGFVVSEEHLKQLHALIPEFKAETVNLWRMFGGLSEEKFSKHIPKDFSWASVYELSVAEHMWLALASLGGVSVCLKAVSGSEAPLDDVLRAIGEFEPGDPADGSWAGGDGGLFEFSDVIGLIIAGTKQFESLGIFGKSLSEFVEDVRQGKEESFLRAIRVDPTILANEIFAGYMTKQHLRGNDNFFRLVRKALGAKWKKPLAHFDLRIVLQAASDGGLLQKLSAPGETDRFFIEELKAYSDKGDDPAGGLQRFIARWKANKINK